MCYVSTTISISTSTTTRTSTETTRSSSTAAQIVESTPADYDDELSESSTAKQRSANPLDEIKLVPTVTSLPSRNSTLVIRTVTSRISLIVGLVFGGLVLIILIACITTYILMKKGYVKMSDQPRTRIKDVERRRIYDSTSSNGAASPSQK
ncbi:hypothetical protein I4U23_029561 [Adineta vaga]|nr:hypothetical protein I4U23_029561 [Adineta vaga]